MAVPLETGRLLMPRLSTAHTTDLAAVYGNPSVARFIGGDRLTADETTRQVGRFVQIWEEWGYGQSAVFEKSTSEFVGRVGLHTWPEWREVELGWVIGAAHQRRGYATEAAQAWLDWARAERPADHLIAVIHPDNTPSIATARKLGFAFDREDLTRWGGVVVFRHELDPSEAPERRR